MLAIHWTPVNKTKSILKNGIKKSRNGLYCFPLTGHKFLDGWWIYFFNQCRVRERQKYNGIVFRIKHEDLPAYFGLWNGATTHDKFKKEIATLKQLGKEFKDTLIYKLGEQLAQKQNLAKDIYENEEKKKLFFELVNVEKKKNSKTLIEKMNDLDFMNHSLSNYQIVLSKSIPPERIIKIIPQENEIEKIIRLKKKYSTPRLK